MTDVRVMTTQGLDYILYIVVNKSGEKGKEYILAEIAMQFLVFE